MKKIAFTFLLLVFTTFIFSQNEKQLVKEMSGYLNDSRDGKRYKTVKIGSQTWMAENLAYKADSGCWAYNDSQSNVTKYGYLYNWETAKTVCPSGWHLPSKAEFETLLNNYGGRSDSKANYTALIPSGNSGFSAPLGGWRYGNGNSDYIGESGSFWSSSAEDDTYAWGLYMSSYKQAAYLNSYVKESWGFSVRCIQDN